MFSGKVQAHFDGVHERVEAVFEELETKVAQKRSNAESRSTNDVSVAVAQSHAIARHASLLLSVVKRHITHLQIPTNQKRATGSAFKRFEVRQTWLRARWKTMSLSLIDLQFFIVNAPPNRECLSKRKRV